MSHELSYDSDIDCVILRIQGKVTMELIRKLAPQVASMFEKTNCHRLLNDMRATTIDISITALFNSPKIIDESGIMRNTKRALVVPPSFEKPEFLENVTRNRGHNLMIFKDIEEAKKWLLAEQ
ncbi:hypothetical protein ACFL6U_13465 [Planctomycetota bacterium]